MQIPRTSIAGLMGTVLVASLGLTALRSESALWAGSAFMVVCAMLALSVVGAICREGPARAWYLGFALFGGGYMALVFWDWWSIGRWNLPTVYLCNWLLPRRPRPGGLGGGFGRWNQVDPQLQAGHCLIGLALATLGGLLARGLFGAPAARSGGVATEPRRGGRRRLRYAIIWFAGLVAASWAGLIGLGRSPGPAAAVAFFAMWSLLGLATVGAIFGPRERRPAWLGVALFGIGYMSVVFSPSGEPGWPHVTTDRLLLGLRERFPWIIRQPPPASDAVATSNARVLDALDRVIPMRYPDETSLSDVLKDIKVATQGSDGLGIPIYVDPISLQEAEKTMQSPIAIDLEGVPLRTSLRLILKQLGLAYGVEGGMVTIGYADPDIGPADRRTQDDPFLVVGQCLFALVAAGLGGVVAPLVCRERAASRPDGSGTGPAPASPVLSDLLGSPGAVE